MAKLKMLLWALACVLVVAAGTASAQTVSIVSGTGQVTCSFFCGAGFFDPLVVVMKDGNGNPVANAVVTWSVSGPGTIQGGSSSATTTTDSTGQTSVTFSQPAPLSSFGQYYYQSAITASTTANSVIFYETTALTSQTGALLLLPSLVSPAIGQLVTGPSGQQGTVPVQVTINAPNVALRVVPNDTTAGPTVKCASQPGQPDGVVLSDASGTATCNLVFGGTQGTGNFTAYVGGNYQTYGPFPFQVTAGLPCILSLVSGNNQSGNAGQNMPSPLVAKVTDCGGTPLNGVPVTWSVTQGAATFTNMRTTSDANGLVSTHVTLGSVGGPVSIKVAVPSGTQTANNQVVSVTFSATVNLVITTFQKLSGDGQDAAQGTAFAQPLVVQVNNAGVPVSGATVNFAVASGSATLSAASAVTNTQGQASVSVTAGQTIGPVAVTASIGSFTQTFNLTVRPPGPSNLTFLNGAGFQQNFIAPCGTAQITGSGLAPGIQGAVVPTYFGPMPLVVANVSVQFGNSFAPIYSVANISGQQSVTVQVPCEVTPGTVPVTVKVGGGSGQFTVQVLPVAPGIFETAMSDNQRRAVLVKPDGTFVSLENPARKGEIIRMYVTGLGNTVTPAVATNSPGIPDTESNVTDLGSIIVGVNNAGVRVVLAKYARDLIGVYEVAFEVPADVPAGNLPLAIAVNFAGTFVFGNPSSIPVQ